MEETRAEIEQIRENIRVLDSADEARENFKKLQIELSWSIVSISKLMYNYYFNNRI